MTEHVHEWRWFVDYITPEAGYQCLCGAQMSLDDAQARLNATERLSAEDARDCGVGGGIFQKKNRDALIAYANILEGK